MRNGAKLISFFGVVFFLLAQSAVAQNRAPAKEACENAKTQLEMNECADAAYRAADKELNAYYASLKEKLEANLVAKLQAAQRAWIGYRDANCEAEAALYEGGSIQPTIRSNCMERLTRARLEELHTIYDTGDR